MSVIFRVYLVGFLAQMDVTKQEDMSAFYRNLLCQTTDTVVKKEPDSAEIVSPPDERYMLFTCTSYNHWVTLLCTLSSCYTLNVLYVLAF